MNRLMKAMVGRMDLFNEKSSFCVSNPRDWPYTYQSSGLVFLLTATLVSTSDGE